jgi:hypothetical protein
MHWADLRQLAGVGTAMLAIGAGQPVMAQGADICRQSIYSQDLHIEVIEVRDIGQGMVQELSRGSRETSGSERISFQHCASGQAINAVVSTWDENGSPVLPNPRDIMMMAMESATTYTMAEIVSQMTAAGVDANLATWDRETCGCAVFYPQARGNKSPWSAQ